MVRKTGRTNRPQSHPENRARWVVRRDLPGISASLCQGFTPAGALATANAGCFFERRDPAQIAKAEQDPKHKMALVFRGYLGQASKWANAGIPERRVDYQVWCGPAMGAFNTWARGTELEPLDNRTVVAIADALMHGAAVEARKAQARMLGLL